MRHCGGYIYHSSSIVILTNRNKRETVTSNTTRQSSALYKGLISNANFLTNADAISLLSPDAFLVRYIDKEFCQRGFVWDKTCVPRLFLLWLCHPIRKEELYFVTNGSYVALWLTNLPLSLRDNAARVNASRNGHILKKIVLLILLSILLGETYAAKMKRNAIVVKVKYIWIQLARKP